MKSLLTVCGILLPVATFAQPGIAEMQQAQQNLSSTFFSAFDCALVIATLLGLNGALKIFYNAQMGKERIDSDVAAWLFAAMFIALSGAFLSALFGI